MADMNLSAKYAQLAARGRIIRGRVPYISEYLAINIPVPNGFMFFTVNPFFFNRYSSAEAVYLQ